MKGSFWLLWREEKKKQGEIYKAYDSGQNKRGLAVAWIRVVMEMERGGPEIYFGDTVSRTY